MWSFSGSSLGGSTATTTASVTLAFCMSTRESQATTKQNTNTLTAATTTARTIAHVGKSDSSDGFAGAWFCDAEFAATPAPADACVVVAASTGT
jgi:hypothetical protein